MVTELRGIVRDIQARIARFDQLSKEQLPLHRVRREFGVLMVGRLPSGGGEDTPAEGSEPTSVKTQPEMLSE